MALLRITACKAGNRNMPISSGSNRNSAPPRPIRPPSAPITAPPAKAAVVVRGVTAGKAVAGMSASGVISRGLYRPAGRKGYRPSWAGRRVYVAEFKKYAAAKVPDDITINPQPTHQDSD